MKQQRRILLKAGMAAGTLAVATSAGLLTPGRVLAAWPKDAFTAKKLPTAQEALLGKGSATDSNAIKVKAPDIAENGAVVSVTVSTTLPAVESISIFVPVNAFPLSASYDIGTVTDGFITGRFKLAKTTDVVAIVKSNGKLYTAKKPVKVTLGGCGG